MKSGLRWITLSHVVDDDQKAYDLCCFSSGGLPGVALAGEEVLVEEVDRSDPYPPRSC